MTLYLGQRLSHGQYLRWIGLVAGEDTVQVGRCLATFVHLVGHLKSSQLDAVIPLSPEHLGHLARP